jgi:hypothetical protein
MLIEQLDQLGEVGERAGEAVWTCLEKVESFSLDER